MPTANPAAANAPVTASSFVRRQLAAFHLIARLNAMEPKPTMAPRYFRIVGVSIVLAAECEVVNRNTIAVKSRELGGWICASSHAARATCCRLLLVSSLLHRSCTPARSRARVPKRAAGGPAERPPQ